MISDDKKPVAVEEDLSQLLSAWREDISNVITELDTARARLKEYEESERHESESAAVILEKDLELEQLESELASCRKQIETLSRKSEAMKDLEAAARLKDRRITFLELEGLETTRSYRAVISDLQMSLREKIETIARLDISIRHHDKTMSEFRQHLTTLRQRYAALQSADSDDNAKAQANEIVPDATPESTRPDPTGLDEFQVMGAEEFLKTQVINMRLPLLKARRSERK